MLVSLLSSRTACYKRHRDSKSTQGHQKKARSFYITWGEKSSVRNSLDPWMFYLHAIYLSALSVVHTMRQGWPTWTEGKAE